MDIDYEIEILKEEYKKELEELHELLIQLNPHCSKDINFECAMERLVGNQLSENEENIFFDILKANKSISDLDIKIKKLEAKKEYDRQVCDCYLSYETQQELDSWMDFGDESVKCYETYIPDDVETGYNFVRELDEQHKNTFISLNPKPIGHHYNLPVIKVVNSNKMVNLEQEIKKCCEERAAYERIQREKIESDEKIQRERYR